MWQAAVYAQGFALSAGLIVAIGAQNVFVLTEGARGRRPWLVAGICTACDALLIGLGVGGVGALAGGRALSGWLALGGALFLLAYGLRALASALRGGSMAPDIAAGPPSTRAVLLTALGVSLLNPHALLDTVVLIGGLASRLGDGGERLAFGLGAATASACWFFSLSLGGRLLAPWLARRSVWRVLDAVVCLTMWTLAAGVGREALAALSGPG